MSTEDQPAPRTRAEARAAREAAEAARQAADAVVEDAGAAEAAAEAERRAQSDARAAEAEADAAAEAERLRLASPADAAAPAADATPAEPPRPSTRRFTRTLIAVLGILAVIVGGFAAVSMFQGPRISDVQVDPSEAIEVSGSRVILTTNQPLETIDESQVTVEPAVPFTLDATGRTLGIRFTVPLDAETEYTVSVADATGTGGGPSADLVTSFATPAADMFLLNRTDGDDTIYRTGVDGDGVPVYAHARINDFRATTTSLVVAVEDDDGSHVLIMDRDGENERALELPGDGLVSSVQVSERGNLVGYIYSDRTITDDEGRASVLVTQSLSGDDPPHIIEVGGEEASIAEWQFVPDSAAVLFIDFAGTLSLDDRSGDQGAQNIGLAASLLGVTRGTYTAIVTHVDGTTMELNLADGSETPLAASDPDYGQATTITPYPGGTLRHIVARDSSGLPTGQAVIRVDDDGAAEPIIEVDSTTAILQACASPSGQYAAITVAPDMPTNTYDDMLVPLPSTLETHLIDLRTGEEIVALTGFDSSWCQTAPSF